MANKSDGILGRLDYLRESFSIAMFKMRVEHLAPEKVVQWGNPDQFPKFTELSAEEILAPTPPIFLSDPALKRTRPPKRGSSVPGYETVDLSGGGAVQQHADGTEDEQGVEDDDLAQQFSDSVRIDNADSPIERETNISPELPTSLSPRTNIHLYPPTQQAPASLRPPSQPNTKHSFLSQSQSFNSFRRSRYSPLPGTIGGSGSLITPPGLYLKEAVITESDEVLEAEKRTLENAPSVSWHGNSLSGGLVSRPTRNAGIGGMVRHLRLSVGGCPSPESRSVLSELLRLKSANGAGSISEEKSTRSLSISNSDSAHQGQATVLTRSLLRRNTVAGHSDEASQEQTLSRGLLQSPTVAGNTRDMGRSSLGLDSSGAQGFSGRLHRSASGRGFSGAEPTWDPAKGVARHRWASSSGFIAGNLSIATHSTSLNGGTGLNTSCFYKGKDGSYKVHKRSIWRGKDGTFHLQ